jgi:putative ABC transport system permease protein
MFRVIFGFLFIIVLIIVVVSVVNTMGMTVMERIREIGTIRAMGVKKRAILKLFALESLLLSCMGCILGMGFTLLGWGLVKVLEPTWVPPHISMRVPIEVYLVPGTFPCP